MATMDRDNFFTEIMDIYERDLLEKSIFEQENKSAEKYGSKNTDSKTNLK